MDSRQKATLLTATIFLIFSHQARAQFETSVPFLLIAPDARSEGMGVTGTGLADDGSAIYWNAGGLGLLNGDYTTATLSTGLPELSSDMYYSLGYSHYVESWRSSMAVNITYFDVLPFYYAMPDPYQFRFWGTENLAVTLGYGIRISPGLGIGANFRFLRDHFEPLWASYKPKNGFNSDFAFDLGFLYRPQKLDIPLIGNFDNRLGIGVELTNLGPKLFYKEQNQTDPLPTNLRLGVSAHLIKSDYHNLYFVLDLTKRMVRYFGGDSVGIDPADSTIIYSPRGFDPLPKSLITSWSNGSVLRTFTFNMGVEYWFGHPRALALRFGYYKQYYDFGGRNLFTLGGGFRYKIFAFDLAYVSRFKGDSPLFNHYRFSLALNWAGHSDF